MFFRRKKPIVQNPSDREIRSLYHFEERHLPGAGAQSFAFIPRYALPVLNFYGPDILAGNAPSPVQPPQVMQNFNVGINGLGGIVHGQFALQPLVDTENQS